MNMTLADELAIIAQDAQGEWRTFLMWVCLSALAAVLIACAVYAARNALSKFCRLIVWLGPIGCALCLPWIAKLVCFGSTKPPAHLWRFEYANGVYDNGSYCTNDQIFAAWTYNLAAMEYTIRATYQDLTITNAYGICTDPLHQLPDAMVRDGSHVWTVANATNLRVIVYALYVPPPAVHTNGVYQLNGVMKTMDNAAGKFITPGVSIHVNLETGESWIITPTNEPPAVSALQSINNQQEAQE